MEEIKELKKYPTSIKSEIRKKFEEGQSVCTLSKK